MKRNVSPQLRLNLDCYRDQMKTIDPIAQYSVMKSTQSLLIYSVSPYLKNRRTRKFFSFNYAKINKPIYDVLALWAKGRKEDNVVEFLRSNADWWSMRYFRKRLAREIELGYVPYALFQMVWKELVTLTRPPTLFERNWRKIVDALPGDCPQLILRVTSKTVEEIEADPSTNLWIDIANGHTEEPIVRIPVYTIPMLLDQCIGFQLDLTKHEEDTVINDETNTPLRWGEDGLEILIPSDETED